MYHDVQGQKRKTKESMKRTIQQQITGSDGERGCCVSSMSTSREYGCTCDPCRDHGSANHVSTVQRVIIMAETNLLANACKATGLAVLVHCLGDPVDSGVTTDLKVLY